MRKGSGEISPSKHGYKIGQRVKALQFGNSLETGLIHEMIMDKDEEGIITGLKGPYTEVLLDSGKFCVRWERRVGDNLIIISESNLEPQYKIY